MAGKYDADLKKLTAQADKLPEMVETIKGALAGANKSKLEEAAKRYESEKKAREKAESELSTVQTELETAENNYKDAEKKYKKLEKESKDLSKVQGDLEKKVGELEGAVEDQDKLIPALFEVAGKYIGALKELYDAAKQEEEEK